MSFKCNLCNAEFNDDKDLFRHSKLCTGLDGADHGSEAKAVSTAPGIFKRLIALQIDVFILQFILKLLAMNDNPKAIFMVVAFYLFVKDLPFYGSIGKKIAGLDIVDSEGNPAPPDKLILRNFTLAGGYVLAAIGDKAFSDLVVLFILLPNLFVLMEIYNAATSSDGRRMGDRIAGTKVRDLSPEREKTFKVITFILFLTVFSGLFFMRTHNKAPDTVSQSVSEWAKFTTPDGEITVLFPGANPQKKVYTPDVPGGEKIGYSIIVDSYYFALFVSRFPKTDKMKETFNSPDIADKLMEPFKNMSTDAVLLASEKINESNFQGLLLKYKASGRIVFLKILLKRPECTYYILSAEAKESDENSAPVKTFLNSIVIH